MPQPHKHQHESYVKRYLESGKRRVVGIGRQIQAVNKSGEVFPIHISLGEFEADGEHMFVAIARDMRVQSDLESALDEYDSGAKELVDKLYPAFHIAVMTKAFETIKSRIDEYEFDEASELFSSIKEKLKS